MITNRRYNSFCYRRYKTDAQVKKKWWWGQISWYMVYIRTWSSYDEVLHHRKDQTFLHFLWHQKGTETNTRRFKTIWKSSIQQLNPHYTGNKDSITARNNIPRYLECCDFDRSYLICLSWWVRLSLGLQTRGVSVIITVLIIIMNGFRTYNRIYS